MAGSLAHITADDGTFTMDLIDNLGDAHEALEECFNTINTLKARWAKAEPLLRDASALLDEPRVSVASKLADNIRDFLRTTDSAGGSYDAE